MLYESIALPLSYVGVNAGAEMATQQYINGLWGGSNRARSGSHGGDGPTWLRVTGLYGSDLGQATRR